MTRTIPTSLPTMEEYVSTSDVGGTYFYGSVLSYEDKKGNTRYARIVEFNGSKLTYQPYTLQGGLNSRTFNKDRESFTIPNNLPPTMFYYDGTAYWGGPIGIKTNNKGLHSHSLYGVSLANRSFNPLSEGSVGSYLEAVAQGTYYQGTPADAVDDVASGDAETVILSKDVSISCPSNGVYYISYQGLQVTARNKTQALSILEELLSWT